MGCSKHHGNAKLALRPVAYTRGLANDLIEDRPNKIAELYLSYGPHAMHSRAQCNAGNGRLRKRRVHYPALAKLVEEAVGSQEHASTASYVLAHYEDPFVAAHLFLHGVMNSVQDVLNGYDVPPKGII